MIDLSHINYERAKYSINKTLIPIFGGMQNTVIMKKVQRDLNIGVI